MMNSFFYVIKRVFFSLLFFIVFKIGLYAQTSEGGDPPSFLIDNIKVKLASIPTYSLPKLDTSIINQKIRKINIDCENCRKSPYGTGVDFSMDLIKEGMQHITQSGTIWQYKIQSEGAKGIQLYFEELEIPQGGKLFLYNNDHSMVLGAYTSKNNKEKGKFAIQPVKGSSITIEYYQPFNVAFTAKIRIFKVIHAFEDVYERVDYLPGDKADFCQIDVACPLGNGWDKEIRSVALVLAYDTDENLAFKGSGALINNANQDAKPYFLSAYHIVSGTNYTEDYFHWVFLFNYQETICGGDGSTISTSQSISGSKLLASARNYDYALFELNEAIPASYNACYAGWDKTEIGGSTSPQTIGIHHPNGDVKKISIDYSNPTDYTRSSVYPANYWDNYPDGYWNVSWDQGITASGSSGSPLFNSSHRIIGQLWAGQSYCSTPHAPDQYGKFSKSWVDGNLQDWLSPYSATTTLDTYCPVYVSHCSNNVQDPGETGVDCGGTCPPCAPSCSDGMQNGDETGIDCGGPSCPPCAPTCFDFIKNGNETGVDCGGSCPPCPVPSCSDHIKNQDETGIDCGGTICPPCSTLCNDNIFNGDELEKDCGGSCAPCYSLCSNGSFENLTCTPTDFDPKLSLGFTIEDKCVDGNWYASHGAPAIRNWDDGTHSLRFYSNSWPDQGLRQDDGLFYQFDSYLEHTKSYTLHFKAKVAAGTSLDACDFSVTSGLEQSHYPQDNNWPEWNPPTNYQINKCRIAIWDGYWNYSNWVSVAIDFTVPNDTYNQLWICPFQYKGNGPVYFYVDEVVLTVHAGTGSTLNDCSVSVVNPCPSSISLTNTSSLPSVVEAGSIDAGTAVNVLSGQTVHFKGANQVTLNPGFYAYSGTVFEADIEPCGQLSPLKISSDSLIYSNTNTKPYASIAPEPDLNNKSSVEGEAIEIFPNPTTGIITINSTGLNQVVSEVSFYDLFGHKLAVFNSLTTPYTLNIENFQSGIYIVKIIAGNKVFNKRILLTR